jgi:Zn-finger nucleic acid-binding protein
MTVPSYEPARGPGELVCPKCRGTMRTVDRSGIHLEQCTNCRGIFLDFGELESLTQMEARFAQQAAPHYQSGYGQQPYWGHHGKQKYHRGGFGRLFFSS